MWKHVAANYVAGKVLRSFLNKTIMYGAQAPKIASMLGVSKEIGQKVIDAFWDTNYGLKGRKEYLEKFWESTGKKYILGFDNRKIWIRSKHSLLNAFLQSGGAIGMDLAGIIWHKKALEEGLLEKGAKRTIYYHKLIVASHREVCRKTPLIQGNLS